MCRPACANLSRCEGKRIGPGSTAFILCTGLCAWSLGESREGQGAASVSGDGAFHLVSTRSVGTREDQRSHDSWAEFHCGRKDSRLVPSAIVVGIASTRPCGNLKPIFAYRHQLIITSRPADPKEMLR